MKKLIKKKDIDNERILDVSQLGSEYKEHLTFEQQIFAETFAVTNDKIKSYVTCGLVDEETDKVTAELAANILLKDVYVSAYINELRNFALSDGLHMTYANAVQVLSNVADGTIRDANGNLEFPKVTARANAARELIKILPESLERKKLEVDTQLQESNVALQKEKLKLMQSGGMGAGENVMLDALKEMNQLGMNPIE